MKAHCTCCDYPGVDFGDIKEATKGDHDVVATTDEEFELTLSDDEMEIIIAAYQGDDSG